MQTENYMDRRSTDTTDINVRLKREVPLTWVISALASGAIVAGAWAWSISSSLGQIVNEQRQSAREIVSLQTQLNEVKNDGKRTLEEITKGVIRSVEVSSRLSDAERRLNMIESRQGGKQP